MTTQPLSVSILSAPLAAIDRRTLSQAWVSALHLSQQSAHDRRTERKPAKRQTASPRVPVRGELLAVPSKASHVYRSAPQGGERRKLGSVTFERRTAKTPLARRIERLLLRSCGEIERATITAGVEGARVRVMVQTTRSGARLIALCAPRVREAVDRALAQARFALAARGIEVVACSSIRQ